MPPPVTGRTIPTQALGPKKGAVTWVSERLRSGDVKDWSGVAEVLDVVVVVDDAVDGGVAGR